MENPIPRSATPQKRPHSECDGPQLSTPIKPIPSNHSTPLSVLSTSPSPVKITAASILSNDVASSLTSQSAPPSNTTSQPAKRRKLTQQEKNDQRMEKEIKAKARAEKKAQKEAEEKVKAEQKARRDEEKQKKADEQAEKKRQKEEEQQQKEEEKAKKERSQLRLNAFFAKPKPVAVIKPEVTPEYFVDSKISADLSTSISLQANAVTDAPVSPKKTLKVAPSDYDRYFLPFSLPAHAVIAPYNAYMEDAAKRKTAQERLDHLVATANQNGQSASIQRTMSQFSRSNRRSQASFSISQIVDLVDGSSDPPMNVKSTASMEVQPTEMLKHIPLKYIHHARDVRPPYYGTYTQQYSTSQSARLARNPHLRIRKDTNYDYDSEAEWEEPEEGEDLDSEGEEDLDDDAEDDMDGFLDDAEDPQVKRRMISGDLEPLSTGLCWEDPDGVSKLNDGSGAICTDFKGFEMGFLLDCGSTIDPFSTSYWEIAAPLPPAPASSSNQPTLPQTLMNPSRAPLANRNLNGMLNTLNKPSTTQQANSGTTTKSMKPRRMIPAEDYPAFKAEIEGKDLTKLGMIEALKKAFPKLPKDAIANTLSAVAARVGPSEKEKRWVLIST